MPAPQVREIEIDPDDLVSLELRVPKALWQIFERGEEGFSTYALIDAWRYADQGTDLEDDVGDYNLRADSLFRGKTQNELADVAPTLVEVRPDTKSGQDFLSSVVAKRWSAFPGIIIVSKARFETIHAACRKVTRFQDIDDSWYFNRFWEPEFFLYFALMCCETRLFHHLRDASRFILPLAGSAVEITPEFSATGPLITEREAQADLVFDAGKAMVANREFRRLADDTPRGLPPNNLYDMWRGTLGTLELDYGMLEKSVQIVHTLSLFYGEDLVAFLDDKIMERMTNPDTGRQTDQFIVLSDLCAFARLNRVRPDRLQFRKGEIFWQDQQHL